MVRTTKRVMLVILILMMSTCSLGTERILPAKATGSSGVEWTTTYGACAAVQVEDGGYLFGGSELGLLVKTDAFGNVEWNKTYAEATGSLLAVFKTADKGYIATGTTEDKTWLLKVDALGNVLWNRTYEEKAACAVQTSDEGCIFVGNALLKVNVSGGFEWSKPIKGSWVTESGNGYIVSFGVGGRDVRLIRTDANGIVEWNKTWVLFDHTGTTGGQLLNMIGTNDGGVLFTGLSYGGPDSSSLETYKFNSTGGKEWETLHGRADGGGAVVQTADGGYGIIGHNGIPLVGNAFLLKINQTGGFEWNASFKPDNYTGESVIETIDGGFVVTGRPIYKFSPYPRHNIAISKVIVPLGGVKEGDIALILVNVENNGDYNETTKVFLYNDSSLISSENVTLLKGTSEMVIFSWNTTGVKLGPHTILANATGVIGETYLQDNVGQATIVVNARERIGSKISISTFTQSALAGMQISISGALTDLEEKPIPDELISLSYKVLGIETWKTITSVHTGDDGQYSAVWIPTATGYFTLKAEWAGNATIFGASNTTTLSNLAYNKLYVFTVESNSTVSELAFNATDQALSFIATGVNGTRGYARVTVAKSLVTNATNIRVYLDGNQTRYSMVSTDDSWLLTFNYTHSLHHITVDLQTATMTRRTLDQTWMYIIVAVAVIALVSAIIIMRRKKQKPNDERPPTMAVN